MTSDRTKKLSKCISVHCTAILSLSGHRSGNKASNFVALSLNESISNFTSTIHLCQGWQVIDRSEDEYFSNQGQICVYHFGAKVVLKSHCMFGPLTSNAYYGSTPRIIETFIFPYFLFNFQIALFLMFCSKFLCDRLKRVMNLQIV